MAAPQWTTADIPSQAGKTALITGANSGIGYQAALELARHGAHVLLACRSLSKGEAALARLLREAPGASAEVVELDMASLASIRSFAAAFAARNVPLDLLINNAGVMAVPTRELTVDGFERQFGTNFLGPFALTALLLPALLQAAAPRVTTVASSAANFGRIDFNNLQSERKYSAMAGAYAQAKLADLIFALELQRRATAAGIPLTSTAAHPGYAVTNLQSTPTDRLLKFGMTVLKPFLSQDAAQGALPTLFAAVAPEAQPGGYYGPDGFQELKGFPTTAKIPASARDIAVARHLWETAEQLTGVAFRLEP